MSFKISELRATISYAAVLHDGCKFTGKNIVITIEPNVIASVDKTDNNNSSNRSDSNDKNNVLYEKTKENLIKYDKKMKNSPANAAASTTNNSNTNSSTNKQQSEEGQQGLTFIANWIEVVLERLEICVEDLYIIINDPTSKTSLKFHLSTATFYNTNPRGVVNR